jgi:hypothetical protein
MFKELKTEYKALVHSANQNAHTGGCVGSIWFAFVMFAWVGIAFFPFLAFYVLLFS